MKSSLDKNFTSQKNNGLALQPLFLFLVSALAFISDRATKLWFAHSFPHEVSFNAGLSFNIAAPQTIIFILLTVSGGFLLSFLKHHNQTLSKQGLIGLALIAGGALGNCYDRVLYGGVLDIFRVFISWFNLADVFIIGGLLLVIFSVERQHRLGPKD